MARLLLKNKVFLVLIIVVLLGFLIRFYRLGAIPTSLDWDEASLGWNSYSFLKTGSDEYGNPHPVSIRSFNDYKPPLYVYTSIPIIGALGLNEFSIRSLSALAGTGAVVLMFPLVLLLTKKRKVALLTSYIFSLTPWSIQFSRVAFESNLALFWVIAGTVLILWYLQSQRFLKLLLGAIFFVLAIYSYHSTRLFIPVFAAGIGLLSWKTFWRTKKTVVICLIISIFLLIPLARSTLRVGSLQARFSTVSIFSPDSISDARKLAQDKLTEDFKNGDYLGVLVHQPFSIYASAIAKNHLDHFNFDFLFLTGDANERHHAPGVGMLLFIQFPFLIAGLFFLAKKRPTWSKFILLWFLVGPLASAITTVTPHAVRALVMLPPFAIISSYGLFEVTATIKKRRLLVGLALSVIIFVNVYYYLNRYFVQMPVEYAKAWQFGYKQLVSYVLSKEKNYDQIYISGAYDQPYIYFLFYGRISPVVKNNIFFYQGMDKYIFANYCEVEMTPEKKRQKLLIILAPQERTCLTFKDRYKISFPDGSPAFIISDNL